MPCQQCGFAAPPVAWPARPPERPPETAPYLPVTGRYFSPHQLEPLPPPHPGVSPPGEGGGQLLERSNRGWITAVAIVAVLALLAGGLYLALPDNDEQALPDGFGPLPTAPEATTGPGPTVPDDPSPLEWDPEIVDLVEFVEQQRDLAFDRPVNIEYVDKETFLANFDVSELPFVVDYLDARESYYRALGVAEGDIDLAGQAEAAADLGAIAYYEPFQETIVVRDDLAGPGAPAGFNRPVLVHELTHALQDQQFDLANTPFEGDQIETFQMLIEGDASRIEHDYVTQMADDQQADYERIESEMLTEGEALGFLEIATVEGRRPYDAGEEVVRLVVAVQGNAGLDRQMLQPPERQAQMFRASTVFLEEEGSSSFVGPLLFEDGYAGTIDILDPDAIPIEGDYLGAWLLFSVLAEQLSADEAFATVDTIGADGSYIYELDGVVCVALALDPLPAGADLLREGLTNWAAALPHGGSVEEVGTEIHANVCDPGPAATTGYVGAADQNMDVAISRVVATRRALESVDDAWDPAAVTPIESWCLAATVEAGLAVDELPDLASDSESLADLGREATRACLPRSGQESPPDAGTSGECSAANSGDLIEDQAGLPDGVGVLRKQILEAAAACDWDALDNLLTPTAMPAFGDQWFGYTALDGVGAWKDLEDQGQPILGRLVATLESGFWCSDNLLSGACVWLVEQPSSDGQGTGTYITMLSDDGWHGFGQDYIAVTFTMMELLDGREPSDAPTTDGRGVTRPSDADNLVPEGWPQPFDPEWVAQATAIEE